MMVELIGDFGGGLLKYGPPFIIVLSVIVVFHELGHYWMARLFRVRIDSFSIGFGKEIFGWTDRLGTRWRVAWLPLGGYVKFHGDENVASVPDTAHLERLKADPAYRDMFHFKPLYQRALIVVAGPLANFVLAIAVFWLLFAAFGRTEFPARVDVVTPGSVAERAGFQPGDRVLSIDGREVRYFSDLQKSVTVSANRSIDVIVERAGERKTISVTPALADIELEGTKFTQKGGQLGIGIAPRPEDVIHIRFDPLTAFGMAVTHTGEIIASVFTLVGRIFSGTLPAQVLGGPITIAQASGEVASLGVVSLISLVAVLSISVGILNLMPIPVLDGGHLLFYAYEAAAGRPLGERTQEIAFRIGIMLVLGLMLFATWNDLARLKIFGS